MCHLFASIPQENTEMETRSVRMNGQVTSIRLEAAFWQTLEELAESQGMTLAKFLTTLHDEVLELQGRVRNFASLLRCACLVHLQHQEGTVFEKPGAAPRVHPLSGIRIAS